MARIIIIETDEGEHVHDVLERILTANPPPVVTLTNPTAATSIDWPKVRATAGLPEREPAAVERPAPTRKVPTGPTGRRKSSSESEELTAKVAEVYNLAVSEGRRTGEAVRAVDGIRNASMGQYYIDRARAQGLITSPARRGTRPAPAAPVTPVATVAAVPDLQPEPEPEPELEDAPPPKPVFADPAPFIKRGPVDVDAARARASEVV